MLLSDITKLDQKNRTHIPARYLALLGIKNNDFIQIMVDTDTKCIKIVKLNDEVKRILKNEEN